MNSETIISIGTILIALVGAVANYIIKPYIEAKTTEKQRDDVVFWVTFTVNAAEQMKKAGLITIPKKDFVIEAIGKMGFVISEIELDILIEAAVNEINKNKKK